MSIIDTTKTTTTKYPPLPATAAVPNVHEALGRLSVEEREGYIDGLADNHGTWMFSDPEGRADYDRGFIRGEKERRAKLMHPNAVADLQDELFNQVERSDAEIDRAFQSALESERDRTGSWRSLNSIQTWPDYWSDFMHAPGGVFDILEIFVDEETGNMTDARTEDCGHPLQDPRDTSRYGCAECPQEYP